MKLGLKKGECRSMSEMRGVIDGSTKNRKRHSRKKMTSGKRIVTKNAEWLRKMAE